MPQLVLLPKSKEIKIELLKKFGRTPESMAADIESIKEWAKKQPHLPEIPSNEAIEISLIVSKFEFAKTKKMIDTYYTFRGVLPELYQDPEAKEMLNIMELVYWIPLPKVTKNNNRIIVSKLRKRSETQEFNAEALFSYIINMAELIIREDPASTKILFFDCANTQMEHISSISPLMAKKVFYVFEETNSNQLAEIHMFNVPSLMEPFIALLKTFMKAKLIEKMHVHKNIESVFQYLPKENMPIDYGGNEQSLETLHELWKNKVLEFAPIQRKLNLLRTDESKRLEESTVQSELLGCEGNFRKLNVD